MFMLDEDRLSELGAHITVGEIKQQPQLWQEAYDYYLEHTEKIDDFFKQIYNNHDFVRVLFTGAGTSAFVGETVAPYLNKVNDPTRIEFQAVATTDIVAAPEMYLDKEIPTILVSFARSGNSPESVATVELAQQIVTDLYEITITCAAEGKLAQAAKDDDKNLLLLMPEKSNDQGFAMTGSYTCMTLTALLVFDKTDKKDKIVKDIIIMGQQVLEQADNIQKLVDLDFNRVVYLGSGGLQGLAHEAQLKILELTAGKIATLYESPLGFRHGPKSFVDENTLVFIFGSNDEYTNQYDVDLTNEVYHDQIARLTYYLSASADIKPDAVTFNFEQNYSHIPDGYLALPYVIFGQVFAVLAALKVGNTPDTPSKTGTVNRVVKGVIIHDYQ